MQPTRSAPHCLIRVFHQVIAEDLPGCAEHTRNEFGGPTQAVFLSSDLLCTHREEVLALG
jgi:hypothetical protein